MDETLKRLVGQRYPFVCRLQDQRVARLAGKQLVVVAALGSEHCLSGKHVAAQRTVPFQIIKSLHAYVGFCCKVSKMA